MTEHRPGATYALGLGIACAAAFSPVLVDLARSLGRVDGRLAILVAPVLTVLATRAQSTPAPIRTRPGVLLIGAGLAFELVGIALTSSTIARVGLPVAALGLGCLVGRPGPRQLALLCFVVPIPISVTSLTTPWLESTYADICVSLLHGVLGLDISASGPLLSSGPSTLELYASDSGIRLAYVLAALGWLAGVLAERSVPRLFARALLWSLIAWPAQVAACLVAATLVAAGRIDIARAWLDWGVHLTTAAIGLIASPATRRAIGRSASSTS